MILIKYFKKISFNKDISMMPIILEGLWIMLENKNPEKGRRRRLRGIELEVKYD